MFIIELREASAGLRTEEEIDAIVRGIQKDGLQPVLRAMVHAAYSAAGVRPHLAEFHAFLGEDRLYRARREQMPAPGDLFFTPNEAYVLRPSPSKLQLWSIRHHTKPPNAPHVCDTITQAAMASLDGRRLRGMDFTWSLSAPSFRDTEFRGRPRREQRLQSRQAEYTPSEASQASILSSAPHRDFLIRLAQVRGKARSVDAGSEVGPEIPNALLDANLITQEYLLICRQDSHTICSLADKTQLAVEPLGTAKCSICGRRFSDELVQDIFAMSEEGSKLVTKSHWMTVWVTDLLVASGIGRDAITWNATAGEDEIDIITDMYGTRVFFELKDRDFGVGDAYPFLYRLERYGGSMGVVISTDSVAEEVKKLLQERQVGVRQAAVELIENGESIPSQLPRLVDRISAIPATRVLQEFSEPFGVDPLPLFRAWLATAAA
jgi:hypothetical protein